MHSFNPQAPPSAGPSHSLNEQQLKSQLPFVDEASVMYPPQPHAVHPLQVGVSSLSGYMDKPLPYIPQQQQQLPGYIPHQYHHEAPQSQFEYTHQNQTPVDGLKYNTTQYAATDTDTMGGISFPHFATGGFSAPPQLNFPGQLAYAQTSGGQGTIRTFDETESPHSSISGYPGDASVSQSSNAMFSATLGEPSSISGYKVDGQQAKKLRHHSPCSGAQSDKQTTLDQTSAHLTSIQAKKNALKNVLPPAKAACLSCRTRKARCDGQQPVCGQCVLKERECVFVKSRRGGARKKREPTDIPLPPNALAMFLKKLDGMLAPAPDMPDMTDINLDSGVQSEIDPALILRSLNPNDVGGILDAYYSEIHPFQPLLPPVKYKNQIAVGLLPNSPFLLALRCILSLSPISTDPNPSSAASKAIRRSASAQLARQAADRIEELLTEAGENDDETPSIEIVQALSLLGLYEFGQTANAARNRMRMNQAVQLAMEMGLHQVDEKGWEGEATSVEGDDIITDMKRRTWWVIFAGMLISGMVSGKRWIVNADDARIKVKYPACDVADGSWQQWLTSIRITCQAMDIILTLDYNMPNPNAPPSPPLSGHASATDSDEDRGLNNESRAEKRKKRHLHKKMIELDRSVLHLLQRAEHQAVIPLVPGGEEEVVRNQQLAASMMLAVAHIQLHRRQAFPEVALFSRKMCGLPKAETKQSELTPPPSSLPSQAPSQPATRGASPLSAGSSNRQDHNAMLNGTLSLSATVSPPLSLTGQEGGAAGAFVQNTVPGFDGAIGLLQQGYAMDGFLWDSSIFPSSFPTPWFVADKGAAGLYQPLQDEPAFLPPMNGFFTAETGYIGGPLEDFGAPNHISYDSHSASYTSSHPGDLSQASASTAGMSNGDVPPKPPPKTHKAWGVDVKRRTAQLSIPSNNSADGTSGVYSSTSGLDSDEDMDEDAVVVGPDGPFPPGISLQRCATAAHSIVRLEVLHRSASMALLDGPPRWLPFCACGLVSGAYAFLLLCLAVQAGNTFIEGSDSEQAEELEALWTNVKVILAGLEAYGQMWDGIKMMAGEVRAALEAATRLPEDIAHEE